MSDGSNANLHDSRPRPDREASQEARGISKQDAIEASSPERYLRDDGAVLEGKPSLEASAHVTGIQAVRQEYEGILPPPEYFNEYSPNAQEVLLEIARSQVQAAFIDESRRQDELTQAEIKQGYRGQILSTIIIVSAFASATVVIAVTGNAFVGTILAGIPLVSIIGSLFKPSKSRGVRVKGGKSKGE